MPLHKSYDVTSTEAGGTPVHSHTRTWVLRLIGFFLSCALILFLCFMWLPRTGPDPLKESQGRPDIEQVEGTSQLHSDPHKESIIAEDGNEGHDRTSISRNRTNAPTTSTTMVSPANHTVKTNTTSMTKSDTNHIPITLDPTLEKTTVTGTTTPADKNSMDGLSTENTKQLTPSVPATDNNTERTTTLENEEVNDEFSQPNESPSRQANLHSTTGTNPVSSDKTAESTTPLIFTNKENQQSTTPRANENLTDEAGKPGSSRVSLNDSTEQSATEENYTGSSDGADESKASPMLTTEATETNTSLLATSGNVEQNSTPADVTTTPNSPSDDRDAESNIGSQIASQMLFYLNHTADACSDFYEYACGGLEANYQMTEMDLAKLATQKIFDQAEKASHSNNDTEFLDYYNSCVIYNRQPSNESDNEVKKRLAKATTNEVGHFYSVEDWKPEYFNLTTMLSNLLLRDSAPLFDITLDVNVHENCHDEVKPPKFTLKLGPSVVESNLYVDERDQDCRKNQSSAMLKPAVNLRDLYEHHVTCTSSVYEFVESVEVALRMYGLNESSVKETRLTIELDILKNFPEEYRREERIREAHVNKEYSPMNISELQKKTISETFLNWTLLINTLTNSTEEFKLPLQVYFSTEIAEVLKRLSELEDERLLHNAFLGLYAHKVYQELVRPQRDVENYCKRIATKLMGTHASELYMSSFSAEELRDMQEMVNTTFEELKTTLESGVKNETWLKNNDDAEIIKKIRDLKLEVPEISYYRGTQGLNPKNSGIRQKLSGHFYEDTMMLQKNYRESMYRMLEESPSEYKQIWTHFALPYQTSGSAVHGLNTVIMPYGALDRQVVQADKISSRHLVFATLGTRIANLIAHHFDPTGIQYFADKKTVKPPAVFCKDSTSAEAYQKYVNDYNMAVNETAPRLLKLPNEQTVNYTISSLSLNERLSDITGLQIAYDTMSGLPEDSKRLLPWLNNQHTNETRQFFLAYAQMHCTKVPLTSSFASLYEDENLPSRLRILLAASSNTVLGETWNCEIGSNIRPAEEKVPRSFPHLKAVNREQ